MADFLESYVSYLIPLIFLIVALQMFFYHRAGLRIEAGYRAASSANILFKETGASGRRKRPFALGGASNVLDVTVTDREMCITGRWPIFTAMGRTFGLTHRVPLSAIRDVVKTGQGVEVSFVDDSRNECVLELHLEQPDAFRATTSRAF